MIFPALVALTLVTAGDDVVVRARLTTPVTVSATPVTLEVTASVPEEAQVSAAWPAVVGPFEILSSVERSPARTEGRRTWQWDIRLMTFAAGPARIPPLEVIVETEGGARRIVASPGIDVVVQAPPFPGPHAPLRERRQFAAMQWTMLDALIGIAAVFAIAMAAPMLRRQNSGTAQADAAAIAAAPMAPAPTIADLKAALPKNAGQIAAFYDLAAAVARSIIKSGSGTAVATDTLSSRELLDVMCPKSGVARDRWSRCLARIDRVRFGRFQPPASEPAELVDSLRELSSTAHNQKPQR